MHPYKEALRRKIPADAIPLSEFTPTVRGSTKFVRVGDEIRVAAKKDPIPPHPNLVSDLDAQIRRLRIEDPAQLDGGTLEFFPTEKVLRIDGSSDSLGYPLPEHTEDARRITAGIIEATLSGYTIRYDNKSIPGNTIQGDSGEAEYAYFDITED